MTAITPIQNTLNQLIKRDEYRSTLNKISISYENMQTFINNLGQDIASIDEFLEQIERDKAQGFDVGTSEKTLLFQKATLDIDLQFYTSMKKTYLRKIYEDLFNYTNGIINSSIEIEPNPLKRSKEDLVAGKLGGVKIYENTTDYNMSDIYTLLSSTERNLFELSSDIASFNDKIASAEQKMNRGFAVGNLLVNLESQKTKLTMEFKGYIIRLEQFLKQNEKFSNRCLNRVKMISNEIVTEQELEKQKQEEKNIEENNNEEINEDESTNNELNNDETTTENN